LKTQVLIVHGGIASGKTHRGEQIVAMAKLRGFDVHGVLSRRVKVGRDTIGYDMVDLQSDMTQPMVYRKEHTKNEGWNPLRGPFMYSIEAFRDANQLLMEAANKMDEKIMVVVDEYGHLEERGFGLSPGLQMVADSLDEGKLLILCRTDKIDSLFHLFTQNETRVLVIEADQREFMETLADSFI
jgi:nucleoside-triphosphatase THEP1